MIAASAAPAVLDAPPANVSPTDPAASTGVFDALLMQGMAAGTDTASLEAGDTADALGTDEAGDDDTEDDVEASLAFLADLIATSIPQGSGHGAAGGSGGFAGGEGADANDDAVLTAAAVNADAGFALAADADATGKPALLAGLTSASADTLDARQASGDASQNLARAAELLAQPRAAATESARTAVLTHARDPRWADDFSARVSLLVRAGESTASLAMTPLDLGPVEVNVTVKDSQATILFAAAQADTRALIEASLPKLRELLASQGFNLLDASVSSGFSRSKQPAFATSNRAAGDADAPVTEVQAVSRLGLLDLYA